MADNILRVIITGDGKQLTDSLSRLSAAVRISEAQFRKSGQVIAESLQNSFARASLSATDLNRNIVRTPGLIQRTAAASVGIGSTVDTFKKFGSSVNSVLSPLRILANIIPGLGISGLVLALGSLVKGIFQTNKAFSDAVVFSENFKRALEEIGKEADNLKNRLDFTTTIQKLQAQLQFGVGAKADIFGLKAENENLNIFVDNTTVRINQLEGQLNRISPIIKEAQDQIKAFDPKGFLPLSPLAEAIRSFGDINKIPQSALEKFTATEQAFVSTYQSATEELNNLKKRRLEATDALSKNELSIQIKDAEEKKRLQEKGVQDFEKFVDETIRRARQFADEFKDSFVVPDLRETFNKTKQQIFTESQKLLNDVRTGNLKIKIQPVTEIDPFIPNENKILIFDQIEGYYKSIEREREINFTTDLSIDVAINQQKIRDEIQSVLNDVAVQIENVKTQALVSIAEAFGDALGTALAGGDLKDAFRGFVTVIANGFISIGKEMVLGAKAIKLIKQSLKGTLGETGLLIGGLALIAIGATLRSSLSKGVQFRQHGGPVKAGQPYIVGEVGRELFVPSVSGNIIPNHQIGTVKSGSFGNWSGEVVFRIGNNELIGTLSKGQRSQNILV